MNARQLPDLRDVTICAADTINPALAARALDLSMRQCQFGDAILFTHESVPTHARIVPIERIKSREDYSVFMIKELVKHIATPWVLVVQWDGYVVDGSQWRDAFFDYDYLGAAWYFYGDGMDVGNGGFSLRSTRLLKALASDRFVCPADAIEDTLICRTWRRELESEYGVRFAPADVARRFAYEYEMPANPTFGFHGVFNMWRHVDDHEMMSIASALDLRTFASRECLQLLIKYCDLQKFACVKPLYARYKAQWNREVIVAALMKAGVAEARVENVLALCEAA
ncbi:conserved hypothetical protein [Paraburkholderia tropica]|uniref:DUF5672 family protein n=1 Tax=Paraburkholderia tropica TaxID=92647 RepID=UPI001CAE71B7|nr:DUF5672 family protein [Paraburkholderia tropica]CAG9232896.1 conserved hypothetical protein [Paraburkholderia tropica]